LFVELLSSWTDKVYDYLSEGSRKMKLRHLSTVKGYFSFNHQL
jgi:hypothetical protein